MTLPYATVLPQDDWKIISLIRAYGPMKITDAVALGANNYIIGSLIYSGLITLSEDRFLYDKDTN